MKKETRNGVVKPPKKSSKSARAAHGKAKFTLIDLGNGYSKWIEGDLHPDDEALLTDDVRWSRIHVSGQSITWRIRKKLNGSHKLELDLDPQ